jgi:hypothetical protein
MKDINKKYKYETNEYKTANIDNFDDIDNPYIDNESNIINKKNIIDKSYNKSNIITKKNIDNFNWILIPVNIIYDRYDDNKYQLIKISKNKDITISEIKKKIIKITKKRDYNFFITITKFTNFESKNIKEKNIEVNNNWIKYKDYLLKNNIILNLIEYYIKFEVEESLFCFKNIYTKQENYK